jgi:hypothetical protein
MDFQADVLELVDELWATAGLRGADKPHVLFLPRDRMAIPWAIASTRCVHPPVIEIDEATVLFKFIFENAVPHEVAHAVVCVRGSDDDHGPEWQAAVRSLVPEDQANKILEYQLLAEKWGR